MWLSYVTSEINDYIKVVLMCGLTNEMDDYVTVVIISYMWQLRLIAT